MGATASRTTVPDYEGQYNDVWDVIVRLDQASETDTVRAALKDNNGSTDTNITRITSWATTRYNLTSLALSVVLATAERISMRVAWNMSDTPRKEYPRLNLGKLAGAFSQSYEASPGDDGFVWVDFNGSTHIQSLVDASAEYDPQLAKVVRALFKCVYSAIKSRAHKDARTGEYFQCIAQNCVFVAIAVSIILVDALEKKAAVWSDMQRISSRVCTDLHVCMAKIQPTHMLLEPARLRVYITDAFLGE